MEAAVHRYTPSALKTCHLLYIMHSIVLNLMFDTVILNEFCTLGLLPPKRHGTYLVSARSISQPSKPISAVTVESIIDNSQQRSIDDWENVVKKHYVKIMNRNTTYLKKALLS